MAKNKKRSNKGDATGGPPDDAAKHEQKLQAVILADAFTQTFRPLSLDACPMLCPLNNVTLLDYTMDFLAGAGVEELFVVSVHDGVQAHVQKHYFAGAPDTTMRVTVLQDKSLTNAGDALRELDKRNVIQSDPFILVFGDVVTNVDIQGAIRAHKERHKQDSSAIMTLLFKQVGSWHVQEGHMDSNAEQNNNQRATYSSIRASTDDLMVGLETRAEQGQHRIILYDDRSSQASVAVPCSFFASHPNIDLRCDLLDCGIDLCSPDVLARFSDEFDYRDIRREFVANTVAEEEEGLQSKLYAHLLQPHEYAARVHDFRTYAAISRDLLKRWCYPVVPDNMPSGYEKHYRYVQQRPRQYLYRERKLGRTKVGRSSVVGGVGMIGSHCFVGENCHIHGTVIGNHCHIADNVTLIDCHLWDGVCIEEGATVIQSILAQESVIKAGAVVGRGCVIGQGCKVGTKVKLPEFTRLTMVSKEAENEEGGDDAFDDDFGDDSQDDEDEDDDEDLETPAAANKNPNKKEMVCETDHSVVGPDGQGRVWVPSVDSDDDDSNDGDDDEDARLASKLQDMKSRSIGFDPTDLYLQRKRQQQEDNDDGFSDDDNDLQDMDMMDEFGGGAVAFDATEGGGASSSMPQYGRQAGVDVVKELKTICLEFEIGSPIENLAIELNSYKFSQNATYADCTMAATLAILELMKITKDTSDGKLVSGLKSQLEVWCPLLKRMCIGLDEEKSIILALETSAIGGGDIGHVLSTGPSFRFVLQTLHDEDVISEEAILAWATERRKEADEGDSDSPRAKLFQLRHVQDFLEWLEGDDEDDDDGKDESDEE